MSIYLSLRDLLPGSFESDGEEEQSLEETEVKKDENPDDDKPEKDKLKISPSAGNSASSIASATGASPPPPTATPARISAATSAPPNPTPIAAAADPPPPTVTPKAVPIPIRKRGISALSQLLSDPPPLPSAKTGILSDGVLNASPDPTPIAAATSSPPPPTAVPNASRISALSQLLADLPPFPTAGILRYVVQNTSPDMPLEILESRSEEDDGGEFIPPHEILARRRMREACPCLSILSGIGRTLKGRDLIDSRNAVLRLTGYL